MKKEVARDLEVIAQLMECETLEDSTKEFIIATVIAASKLVSEKSNKVVMSQT